MRSASAVRGEAAWPCPLPPQLHIDNKTSISRSAGDSRIFVVGPFLPAPPPSGCRAGASLAASLFLSRTFAAHVLAQFTTRLLGEELSSPSQHAVSRTLCGAFVFVCRQIYNTCEGLRVLQPYGLHRAIAAAWRKVRSQLPLFCGPELFSFWTGHRRRFRQMR